MNPKMPLKRNPINRRLFLKLLGQGALLSCGLSAYPGLIWAKEAFDYALAGQDFIQNKQFEKAVDVLKKAISLEPNNDWAHGLLGRAYLGLEKNAEAIAAFRNAVRINPQDSYSRLMIDIISQKPVKRLEKAKRPPTDLEIKAQEEEALTLQKLEKRQGLDYQVNRVVIDAGHGGFDPGAVGKDGLQEKEITLDIAKRLHETLEKESKIKSFLTRTGDYYIPLSDRTVIANQYQADLFISLHINANEKRTPSGSETYFCSEKASSAEAEKVAALENSVLKYDEPVTKTPGYIDIEGFLFSLEQKLNWGESGIFAQNFQKRLEQRLPFKSRGVHSANFYVLRRAKMPAILLETGFISNPDNEAMLRKPDFRQEIANAITKGIF